MITQRGRKMKLIRILFFLTAAILINQDPAAAQAIYSLNDLMALADTHSETIKIAQEDLYIAQQEEKRALSVLIPRATAYGSLTEYKNRTFQAPDSRTLGLKLTQSFTLNGKELIALDVTRKAIESKTFSLESIRSQYLLQVAEAYYNILSAQKYLEIAGADVERLTTHRNAVKEKLSVGNVTKTDLYRAEAELSKAATERVKAENALAQAKAALQNLVAVEPDFDLKRETIPEMDAYNCTLTEIEAAALENRNEMKEARKNLEIATRTVRYKKSEYWPTVSLEAGYKETDIKYDDPPSTVAYDTEDAYFTGTLSFSLFDGGLRKAEIRQATADQRKAENALSLQEKQIRLESRISYLSYETARTTLLNLQDELKYAQETYKAVQMQYQYGMADSIDMMDANTLLVTAQRRISDAGYTYYVSVLNILYARGDLVSFLLTRKHTL